MKLSELSAEYRSDEAAIRQRIHQLRHQARQVSDPKTQLALQHRILRLQPLLRQARALADLTEHYYDRGWRHHDHYRF